MGKGKNVKNEVVSEDKEKQERLEKLRTIFTTLQERKSIVPSLIARKVSYDTIVVKSKEDSDMIYGTDLREIMKLAEEFGIYITIMGNKPAIVIY